MSKKIIGVTVGTPMNPQKIAEKAKIAETINTALAQAKASGEFDGKDGVDGKDGKDGYTPVKGVDYFDGKDGQDGKDGATGPAGSDGKDGKDGAAGKDGTSPTISVTAITGGHRISITDASGTKTVDIMDGQDGKDGADGAAGSAGKDGSNGVDGQDGEDGVGIASVVQTTTSTADDGNNVITITLTNGQTFTFTVQNGSKGSTGAAGANGKDGKDGSDATVTATNIKSALGYTPADQNDVNELSEEKVDKTYIIGVFEELKVAIEESDIDKAIAILDKAILDLSTLA